MDNSSDIYGENALMKYVALLQTRACREGQQPVTTKTAIQGALTDPSVYVFGALLDHPSVRSLKASGQYSDWLNALEIFAFGTYLDYKAHGSTNFPTLVKNDVGALKKLKMLTIAELATKHRVLSYKELHSSLDVTSVRDLEDIIIECINDQLVRGTLDQRNNTFHINFSFSRDIRPGQIVDLIENLDDWLNSSDTLIETMGKQINEVVRVKEKENERIEALHEKLEQSKKRVSNGSRSYYGK